MDKRRDRKNELRREKRAKTRKDSVCMEYIRLKYGKIYDEVNEVYTKLNRKYPKKFDLRKTEEIKNLEPEFQNPPTPYRLQFGERFILKDNIQLRIPLMPSSDLPKKPTTEIPTPETTTITEVEQQGDIEEEQAPETAITEVIEEGTAFPEIPIDAMSPSLFNELDSQMLDQIINELREDLDLDCIMDSIEEDYDMDMDMY